MFVNYLATASVLKVTHGLGWLRRVSPDGVMTLQRFPHYWSFVVQRISSQTAVKANLGWGGVGRGGVLAW